MLLGIGLPLGHDARAETDTPQNTWRLCNSTGLLPRLPEVIEPASAGETVVQADRIEGDGEDISRLTGHVEIISERDHAQADEAVYDRAQQRIDLTGNVQYRSDTLQVNAESMTTYTDNDSGDIHNASFFLPEQHGSGWAERIRRSNDSHTELYAARFSTCDPQDNSWYFSSSKISLDHDAGFGTAKNLALRFKGVPLFYFPYVSFPIDDRRKSGFLFPTVGSSDRHGFEFELPWYWNIAPQADATLTPHYMARRGLKLDSEWRYLNRWSKNRVLVDYIDDDIYHDTRHLIDIDHVGHLGGHWSTYLRGGEVSDIDYLTDFGDSLAASSQSYISRTAMLVGQWQHWQVVNLLQSYQSVDDAITADNQPYRLAPDISLNGLYSNIGGGVELELDSSYTSFVHSARLTGERLDFWPQLSRPFGGGGWFITPSIANRYTGYRLDTDNDPLAADEEQPSRNVPVSSLDAGLIFERLLRGGETVQTFEPRLYYLNVPYRDQSDLPIFDTSLPDFALFQLYADNRFVGADRMGDTEQVAVSVASRWLDRASGAEFLQARLGQIYYQKDRRVTLPGGPIETAEKSGLLANLTARMGDYWSTSLDLEWNPDSHETDKELYRLRYNRNNRYVFNVGYRFRRPNQLTQTESIEQSDVSFILPAGSKWSLIGRWNYSIEGKQDLEKFIGFEYESCCWAFRLLAREFLLDATASSLPGDARVDRGIYFELSFKGLAGVGSGVGRRLEESIIGYQDPFE